MLLRHAIGAVLRRLRLERGETLRQLSETASVSIPYLSEIERGRKEASSEILATLCRVFGIGEGELLTRVAAEFAASELVRLRSREASGATAPVRELASVPVDLRSVDLATVDLASVDLASVDLTSVDSATVDLATVEPLLTAPRDATAPRVLLAA